MDVTVYLVPAAGRTADDLWYPEAVETLSSRGFAVVVVPAPPPVRLDTWSDSLRAAAVAGEGPVTVVGHDLGCLAVLRWLDDGGQADYTILVAPPNPVPARLDEIGAAWPPRWDQIRENGREPMILWSDDDPEAPLAVVEEYRAGLRSELTVFQGYGRFMTPTFPDIEYYVK